MAIEVEPGRRIHLTAADPLARRREWRPWKARGYRVAADDGVTVWHEREAIRQLVLEAFAGVDADVFLFGSQATGEAGPRSDYDVGYWAEGAAPRARLAELGERLEELPIPSHVELVDFRQVTEAFAAMVLEREDVDVWKKRSGNSLFT